MEKVRRHVWKINKRKRERRERERHTETDRQTEIQVLLLWPTERKLSVKVLKLP